MFPDFNHKHSLWRYIPSTMSDIIAGTSTHPLPVSKWALLTDFQLFKINTKTLLILNLLNFLNGIIHFPFIELPIINFRDIKMRNCSLSANSIGPDETARLALYWWQSLFIFTSIRNSVDKCFNAPSSLSLSFFTISNLIQWNCFCLGFTHWQNWCLWCLTRNTFYIN